MNLRTSVCFLAGGLDRVCVSVCMYLWVSASVGVYVHVRLCVCVHLPLRVFDMFTCACADEPSVSGAAVPGHTLE